MTLYLDQPELHNLNCRTCWLYAIDTNTYQPISSKRDGGRSGPGPPQRRIQGCPPPCAQCAKESPAKAAQHELSDKNWRAYQFYLRQRAMNFNALTKQEQTDPIVQRNMKIIDEVLRAHEERRQMSLTALTMQGVLAKTIAGVNVKKR